MKPIMTKQSESKPVQIKSYLSVVLYLAIFALCWFVFTWVGHYVLKAGYIHTMTLQAAFTLGAFSYVASTYLARVVEKFFESRFGN